jgi:mannose-1-phosphate guanylyltransferase
MIIVIIAGGSGTRLWPLSTNNFPKQLLSLANELSMVQNTLQRAKLLSDTIYVVPDNSHLEEIKKQLPELDEDRFITEPARRGTANCIVAALSYIQKKHGVDEPIAFIHADHHIRDTRGFVHTFENAAEVSASMKKIVLIGIEPNYPATGFGYIEKGKQSEKFKEIYEVDSFKEKPDYDTAKKYVRAGSFLWNCGYFVGSVNTFLEEMRKYSPELKDNYLKLKKITDIKSNKYKNTYLSFKNEVIDVALIEKSKDLVVIPASFDWMDVGNFKDLHQANDSDEFGNYAKGRNIHSLENENSYIRNETNTPIVVIGLDNIVVINTKDGILVARKDLSYKVGEIAKKIQKL